MIAVQPKPGRLANERSARLRFSLRTLLVAITILCIWLVWQGKTVRDRKAALTKLVAAGGHFGHVSDDEAIIDFHDTFPVPNAVPLQSLPPIPWVRHMIGDVGIAYIELPRKSSRADQEQITRLFPEAEIGFPSVPWPTIELPAQPYDLQTFPTPFSTDKSLINDLPSNDHQIRFDDFP